MVLVLAYGHDRTLVAAKVWSALHAICKVYDYYLKVVHILRWFALHAVRKFVKYFISYFKWLLCFLSNSTIFYFLSLWIILFCVMWPTCRERYVIIALLFYIIDQINYMIFYLLLLQQKGNHRKTRSLWLHCFRFKKLESLLFYIS